MASPGRTATHWVGRGRRDTLVPVRQSNAYELHEPDGVLLMRDANPEAMPDVRHQGVLLLWNGRDGSNGAKVVCDKIRTSG